MGYLAIQHEVEKTYEKVKSLSGWAVDQHIVLTITSQYVTTGQEFVAENFNRTMDAIKAKSNWLSPLRGSLLSMMAAFLDKNDSDIDNEVYQLFKKQKALRSAGFRNTIHSYLATLLMTDDPSMYAEEAKHAKKLYDEMKKQHIFLTSDDDYTYAVALSKRNNDPAIHAKAMRTYYDALRKAGFRAGNELQWMSQVLTYLDLSFNPELVAEALHKFDKLKENTKVRPVHYPMIGFLTVFEIEDCKLVKIIELTKVLEQSKPFKRNREMALSVAIGCIVHEMTETMNPAAVNLAASIELVLQAHQAVMAATIAMVATTAATTSNN